MLGRVAERILSMVVLFLLVRLLSPTDFGLMAMAGSLIAIIQSLTAFGFDWALVRHPDPTRQHFDTAWTMQLMLAIASCLALICLAHPMAAFYREPKLVAVICALAAIHLLWGFENSGVAYLRRQMQFDREFILVTVPRLASMLVTIPLAYLLRSYWALIIGLLASRLTSLVASYLIHPFRPRLSLSKWRELISFSGWLQMLNILESIRLRLPDLALGRMHGAHSVAVYSIASELASLAVTEIAAPINRVMFSKYSAIQGDIRQLAQAYLSVAAVLWLITIPVAVGMALVSRSLVIALLGPAWAEAMPVIQLLSVAMLGHIMTANTHNIFMAKGSPEINTKLLLLFVIVQTLLIFLLVPGRGAVGAAAAHAIAVWLLLPPRVLLLQRMIGVGIFDVLVLAWRPIAAACVMAGVVGWAHPLEAPVTTYAALVELVSLSALGAVTFSATVALLWFLSGMRAGSETQLIGLLRPTLDKLGAIMRSTRLWAWTRRSAVG